jgi:hypothetical protein
MHVTIRTLNLITIITFNNKMNFFKDKVLFCWFINLEILYQSRRLFNARYDKNVIIYGELRPTAGELSCNSCGGPE